MSVFLVEEFEGVRITELQASNSISQLNGGLLFGKKPLVEVRLLLLKVWLGLIASKLLTILPAAL